MDQEAGAQREADEGEGRTVKKGKPKVPPKAVRDIWAKVPKIECKGLCSNSCGPIPCSSVERKLVESRAGKKLGTERLTCTMLKGGRCTVYSVRPLICRVWGLTPKLKCPHGCLPERYMTDAETMNLFKEIEAICGDSPGDAIEAMLATMTPEEQEYWQATAGKVAREMGDQMIKESRRADSG